MAAYAEITRADPNPLKRWLQQRRLADALRLLPPDRRSRVIDYGGGDGEFASRVAERSGGEVICFEPEPQLLGEAQVRLAALPGARVARTSEQLPSGWAQTVFCLEVLEHLPEAATSAALDAIHRVLEPGGLLIIGAPVEIGPPALVKGLFRWARRPRSSDAHWPAILAAAAGRPGPERELAALGHGLPYFPFHLGFDHRRLEALLTPRFRVERRWGSPLGTALSLFNSELYLLARRTA